MRDYVERISLRVVRERVDVRGAGLPGRLRGPADAFRVFNALYSDEPVELFVVFCLNARHHIVRHSVVTRGILDSSLVHPRNVFQPAFESNAAAIVVAHNHPSGDPAPSSEDRAVTRQLVEAGRVLGIPCLDHIVCGQGSFVSITQIGDLEP